MARLNVGICRPHGSGGINSNESRRVHSKAERRRRLNAKIWRTYQLGDVFFRREVPRLCAEIATDAVSGIRSVGRALSLLSFLGPRGSTLTELASGIDVPVPTVLRLLRTLEVAGYVQRMDSGKYFFGPQCLRLGALADDDGIVRWLIRDSVSRLRDETKETASFWITEGEQRVCIELAESPERVRWVGHIGMRSPLTSGAAGKVLLAFEAGLAPPGKPLRAIDHVDESSIVQEIATIREQGHAMSMRETSADSWGIATPVFLKSVVLGALAIGVPISRTTPKVQRALVRKCSEVSTSLTKDLGGPFLGT